MWLTHSVWVVRTEDLLPLLAGIADPVVRRSHDDGTPIAELRAAVRIRTRAQLALLTDQDHIDVSWSLVRTPRAAPEQDSGRAGRDNARSLATLFHDSGRPLVIVGSAGSGKTTMAMSVMSVLLDSGYPPVPIWLSLGSWDPAYETAVEWMSRTIAEDYAHIAGISNQQRLRDDLHTGRILPILDGFDEIKQERRREAAEALNVAVRIAPAIVTSRPDQLAPDFLPTAVVVRTEPVRVEDVTGYLTAGGRDTAWAGVTRALAGGTQPDLAAAFTSPLMAWLARTVYAPRSSRREDASALLDTDRFPDRASVERHLMTELVPSVFARGAADSGGRRVERTDPAAAEHWLGFLSTGSMTAFGSGSGRWTA